MTNRRVCRICLRVGLHPILIEGQRKRMLTIICSRSKLRLTRNASKEDDLPSWICYNCDSRLPSAAAFVALCCRSERRLLWAQRLKISFDTLNQLYKKNKSQKTDSIKETPKPQALSPIEGKYWIHNNYELTPMIDVKPKEYKDKVRLKNNETKTGRPLTFKECKFCKKSFCGSLAFKEHSRTHRGERSFKCSHCGVSFLYEGWLAYHLKCKHQNPKTKISYVCHLCGKVFLKKPILKQHLMIHTNEKPHECTTCKQRFTQPGQLKTHQMVHTDERPFPCNKCNKRFKLKTCLRRHMSVHAESHTFKCDMCDQMLKSKTTLRQHIENIHKWTKPCVCDLCGATLATKDNLKQHVRAIHSNQSGTCKLCNKHFSNLSEHKRTHTGETPFDCNLCSKQFGHKRSLTAHVKKHNNLSSGKFICEVCKRLFAMKCLLDFHMTKYHNQHKPYICECCSKGFYRLSDLSKHFKNHHLIHSVISRGNICA